MLRVTTITWLVVIFGLITFGPLVYAQMIMLRRPRSQRASDLMIGKGETWRDKSHFKSAYSFAWADWMFFLPLFVAAIVGVLLGQAWGYVLLAIAGGISLYINIVLWFFEREYVYPAVGPVAYYTYIWGNFIYWGILALVYSILRVIGIDF